MWVKFSHKISEIFGHYLKIFLLPLSLSSLSETIIMCKLVCWMVSHKSLRLCSLFHVFYFLSVLHTG